MTNYAKDQPESEHPFTTKELCEQLFGCGVEYDSLPLFTLYSVSEIPQLANLAEALPGRATIAINNGMSFMKRLSLKRGLSKTVLGMILDQPGEIRSFFFKNHVTN